MKGEGHVDGFCDKCGYAQRHDCHRCKQSDSPAGYRDNVVDRLTEAYKLHPVEVAKACDEAIDRSGNLLGWLRELARI